MLPERWTPLKFHEKQDSAWTSRARFMGLDCGRGSGKTELAKRRLVRYLPVKKPWADPRYFYGAPTQAQAMRIAWLDLKNLVPEEWKKREITGYIETVFGSSIMIIGLDKPQRAEGLQWDGCVLDESCDLYPGTFDRTVRPMLTHRRGWCWRIGVPKRRGPGAVEFREFCESARGGRLDDTEAYNWPSSDIVPEDELRVHKTSMDPKDYLEQFEACWQTAGGAIFYAFNRDENVRPCSYVPEKPIYIGSDFNVDPMAWVIFHVYDDERMEVFDELFLRDCNTPKALDVLWGRYHKHKAGFRFYGDATSQARKTSATQSDYNLILNDKRFQQAGRFVRYPKSNPLVLDRIAATNRMLCNAAGQRRIHVDPSCKNLIADLENRFAPPGESMPQDVGDLGHITDAVGYPIYQLFPIRGELMTSPGEIYMGG